MFPCWCFCDCNFHLSQVDGGSSKTSVSSVSSRRRGKQKAVMQIKRDKKDYSSFALRQLFQCHNRADRVSLKAGEKNCLEVDISLQLRMMLPE